MISPRAATLIGLSAILMWSALAALTVATGDVPPFLLAALTFAIGGGVGALSWLVRPHAIMALCQPPLVWLVGVGGLFGYHALYFIALRNAPPAEAGLLNYMWPLLIVLFAAALPGERLRLSHIAGALLGLAGTIVLFAGNGLSEFDAAHAPGFAAALLAAFVWSGYSVLSRLFAAVPTDAVAGFCLITAILSFACHLAWEPSRWPNGPTAWLAIAALGVGPVGLAFYAWDIGMKRGDIRLLGVASYAAPLVSTGLLVLTGITPARATLAIAAVLIAAGGLIAAKTFVRPQSATQRQ